MAISSAFCRTWLPGVRSGAPSEGTRSEEHLSGSENSGSEEARALSDESSSAPASGLGFELKEHIKEIQPQLLLRASSHWASEKEDNGNHPLHALSLIDRFKDQDGRKFQEYCEKKITEAWEEVKTYRENYKSRGLDFGEPERADFEKIIIKLVDDLWKYVMQMYHFPDGDIAKVKEFIKCCLIRLILVFLANFGYLRDRC
jgi:hypothetical protein